MTGYSWPSFKGTLASILPLSQFGHGFLRFLVALDTVASSLNEFKGFVGLDNLFEEDAGLVLAIQGVLEARRLLHIHCHLTLGPIHPGGKTLVAPNLIDIDIYRINSLYKLIKRHVNLSVCKINIACYAKLAVVLLLMGLVQTNGLMDLLQMVLVPKSLLQMVVVLMG